MPTDEILCFPSRESKVIISSLLAYAEEKHVVAHIDYFSLLHNHILFYVCYFDDQTEA